jgi:hypothetical protein
MKQVNLGRDVSVGVSRVVVLERIFSVTSGSPAAYSFGSSATFWEVVKHYCDLFDQQHLQRWHQPGACLLCSWTFSLVIFNFNNYDSD